MKSFWEKLPRPFFVQAPMDDVTDAAFRRLIAKYSSPDIPRVMYTEFTSADGILLAGAAGQKKLRRKLIFSESERPIVAQLFTASVERMEAGAKLCAELGFDGFDINMGCPDKAVEKSGCGAALMKNPSAARELIQAAKKSGLPVSVKTRIGYNKDELDTWLPELLAEAPAAIILHARTRKEMSDVPAHWDAIARAVKIRDELGSKTLIVGNGDVKDIAEARTKATETGCDGIMLGRAVFGNPWLFSNSARLPAGRQELAHSPEERIRALLEHLELFDELLSETTHYATMKKHFKAYIFGWPACAGRDGAKDLRVKLMETENVPEAQALLRAAL